MENIRWMGPNKNKPVRRMTADELYGLKIKKFFRNWLTNTFRFDIVFINIYFIFLSFPLYALIFFCIYFLNLFFCIYFLNLFSTFIFLHLFSEFNFFPFIFLNLFLHLFSEFYAQLFLCFASHAKITFFRVESSINLKIKGFSRREKNCVLS